MTTPEYETVNMSSKLSENLAKVEQLSLRLTAALARRQPHDAALDAPSQELMMKAAQAYLATLTQNPAKLFEHQVSSWTRSVKHYLEAQQALATGEFKAPADQTPKDRRFANPLWETHPGFNFLKQQYLIQADAVATAVTHLEGLSQPDHKRIEYFTRQIIDMMSPANFLGTNPDALEKAVQTEGESLVTGLENLIADIENNDGELLVRLADKDAFVIGQNIATTKGSVVFRNRMLELIQYAPTTAQVHARPLLIFPPWINKYYVLDLKPQNSLIKWIVDQGFTLFVVSWVNPDKGYQEVGMDDYIREGYLTAMAEVRRITGEAQVNAVGYCIAGTTLGLTLAHLERAGDQSVNSATFFTTMTDFSDPGEVGVFLADDFIDGIDRQMQVDGVLDKSYMARTFSFLRSNDLIYGPAIKSYMLGEAPPAFDLLFWNGDGTNLPRKMAIEYLRGLCVSDGFATGSFPVFGDPVTLSMIKTPLCAIACQTDHIAHWRGSFNGVKQMGSKDKTFILSQSGHIAGIINPPTKDKYGHYSHDGSVSGAPEDWLSAAQFHPGSWWPRWGAWLAEKSGELVEARIPKDELCPAPGTYVLNPPKS